METLSLDTLMWRRLSCAGCGRSTEVLELDIEFQAEDAMLCRACGGGLLDSPADAHSQHAEPEMRGVETESLESELETETPLAEPCEAPVTTRLDHARPDGEPKLADSTGVEVADGEDDESKRPVRRRHMAGAAVSTAVHAVVLLILACIVLGTRPHANGDAISAAFSETGGNEPRSEVVFEPLDDEHLVQLDTPVALPDDFLVDLPLVESVGLVSAIEPASASESVAVTLPLPEAGGTTQSGQKPRKDPGEWKFESGHGFTGRSRQRRAELAQLEGGTAESEAAVEAGLMWLARHQRQDGSWSFQHLHRVCDRGCLPPASIDCKPGATGFALLCFLGAGYTHAEVSPYQEVVAKGLRWLAEHSERRHGDLRATPGRSRPEGHSGMYAQGAAAMALCEAYGMTRDRVLRVGAEESINFIASAQDPKGGGWRYELQQRGDTSLAGWQVMAMVSARMAGLEVPDEMRSRVINFLDSMYHSETRQFGYEHPYRGTLATTAIGDLCSMYLRSTLDRTEINEAVELLAASSPVSLNEYARYYVAQVLHHRGGDIWKQWNETSRDTLVARQRRDGHAAGSWDPASRWAISGGRLYATAMNLLTLEVYYRHMPLYRDGSFRKLPIPAKNSPPQEPSRDDLDAKLAAGDKPGPDRPQIEELRETDE